MFSYIYLVPFRPLRIASAFKPFNISTLPMISPTKEHKHVACSRCRERKIKCDGVKPTCRRCHKNGQPCSYISHRRIQGKNEWIRHLRTFSAQPGMRKAPRSVHHLMNIITMLRRHCKEKAILLLHYKGKIDKWYPLMTET